MKALVIVKDGTIVIRSSPGVETALIVEGEDIDLPDDWGDLPHRVVHTLDFTLNRENLEQKRPPGCPGTQLAGPRTIEHHENGPSNLMNAPYCMDCDGNHPTSVDCDGLPRDQEGGDVFSRDGRS